MKNCTDIDISKKNFDVHLLTGISDHYLDYPPENIGKSVSMFPAAEPKLIQMSDEHYEKGTLFFASLKRSLT